MARKHSGLVERLRTIPDPRRPGKNLRHQLVDVLALGFCAVLGGAEDFVEMEQFARNHEEFFAEFLELPGGIPSHDTFRRVFSAVRPEALQAVLMAWLAEIRQRSKEAASAEPRVVAIDGKTLRRTFDAQQGWGALHVVSAWASEQGLTMGQVAVAEKSNEITAIPQLLDLLDLKDCVVTIDAAGCQKAIAEKIVAQGGHYVLALKDNQPTLHAQVGDYFLAQIEARRRATGVQHQREEERGHGRSEWREVTVAPVPAEWSARQEWSAMQSLVMVVRESTNHTSGQIHGDVRYFISSLPPQGKRLAHIVRQHWGIENGLHWVLDVAFNEDRLRLRHRQAVNNIALLNRLAATLLKQDRSIKAGIKCKRKAAGWNTAYLAKLLSPGP